MRAAGGHLAVCALLAALLLAPPGGAAAAGMQYGAPMRLQSPPKSINTPGLKCGVCVVVCDAIQHEMSRVNKWTESKCARARAHSPPPSSFRPRPRPRSRSRSAAAGQRLGDR